MKKKTNKKCSKKIMLTGTFRTTSIVEAMIDRDQYCVKLKDGRYIYFSASTGESVVSHTLSFNDDGGSYES